MSELEPAGGRAENDPAGVEWETEAEAGADPEVELVAENDPPARGPESPLKRIALTQWSGGISARW